MTFENSNGGVGSMKTALNSNGKFPSSLDTRNRMLQRPRLVNSFRHRRVQELSEEFGGTGQHHSANQRRRSSCPSAKSFVSSRVKEKRTPITNVRIESAEFAVSYPTPELNTDIFASLQDKDPNSTQTEVVKVINIAVPTVERESIKPLQTHGAERTAFKLPNTNETTRTTKPEALSTPSSPSTPRHWGSTISGMRNNRRSSVPVTTLERELESSLTFTTYRPEKNEAEILEPGTHDRLNKGLSAAGAAVLRHSGVGGGAGSGAPANRKPRYAESADRELRSLYMNCMEQRRLKSAFVDIERRSTAGAAEHKNLKEQISREREQLFKRTPTTDDWLSKRKVRTTSLQERERENITRRYSRRARHFRAPPELQDTVSGIRSRALFQAGLLADQHQHQPIRRTKTAVLRSESSPAAPTFDGTNLAVGDARRFNDDRDREDEVQLPPEDPITQVASVQLDVESLTPPTNSRRGSMIGGDALDGSGQEAAAPTQRSELVLQELLQGHRRLSMADIKSVKGVLQASGPELYNGLGLPVPAPRRLKSRGKSAASAVKKGDKSFPNGDENKNEINTEFGQETKDLEVNDQGSKGQESRSQGNGFDELTMWSMNNVSSGETDNVDGEDDISDDDGGFGSDGDDDGVFGSDGDDHAFEGKFM